MTSAYQLTWRNYRERVPMFYYNATTHKFSAARVSDKVGVVYGEDDSITFSLMESVRMTIAAGVMTVVGQFSQILMPNYPRLDFERVGLSGVEILGSIQGGGTVYLRDLREADTLPAFTDGILLDANSCILPGGIWYASQFIES